MTSVYILVVAFIMFIIPVIFANISCEVDSTLGFLICLIAGLGLPFGVLWIAIKVYPLLF